RIRIIPQALAEAVKPIEKISDIRIFDTGGMLGRAAAANGGANGSGIGLGDGIAGQLLSYQAHKPIIDRILPAAGLDGPDPLKALLGGTQSPGHVAAPEGNSATATFGHALYGAPGVP